MHDTVVIGGGVTGLVTAWRLTEDANRGLVTGWGSSR